MADILQTALAEQAQIERQIDELRDRKSRLDAFIAEYRRLAGASAHRPPPPPPPLQKNGSGSHRRPFREVLIECSEKILSDGASRHTRDLVEAIEQRGIRVRGKDPAQYLSAILSREKSRFQADRRFGWSLVATEKTEAEGVTAPSAPLVQH